MGQQAMAALTRAHAAALDAIAKVSPYLTGLVPWSPAPTSTADGPRPGTSQLRSPLAAAALLISRRIDALSFGACLVGVSASDVHTAAAEEDLVI